MRRMTRPMGALACLATLVIADPASGQQQGGTVTVRSLADVDYLDPGQTYYSYGFAVTNATQRPLYSYFPGATTPQPDLAVAPPEVAADGKTITVRLRTGVRFSPPVNREVTSADVKYAIERAFAQSLSNGYVTAYFDSIVGAPRSAPAVPKAISGLVTPDAQTLVIRLRRPDAAIVASALALPISAPVPREVAGPRDRKRRTTYDNAVVATGPYMVAKRRPGRLIQLVRNPNWDRATDVRPAYLDAIDLRTSAVDPDKLASEVLAGSRALTGDFLVPAATIRRVAATSGAQLAVAPAVGTRYVALNTQVRPLNNVHVRRAILAGMNRECLRTTRGGAEAGTLATHFLAPGNEGFTEAGGAAGTGVPFLATPTGDRATMKAEFRRAGFKRGRYTGRTRLLAVASNGEPGATTAREAVRQMRAMGFRIRLKLVSQDVMYTKWCGRPASRVAICPTVGWFADVSDPQGQLAATFGGKAIVSRGNVNWPQLRLPSVDRAIAAAKPLAPGPARTAAWADVDRRVTAAAPAVPYLWDTPTSAQSADVAGQLNPQSQMWDYAYTALR